MSESNNAAASGDGSTPNKKQLKVRLATRDEDDAS